MFAGLSMNHVGGGWLSTASQRTVLGIAVGVGACVFCVIGAADWLMFDAGLHPFGIMLGSDALAAILAFGFTYRIACHARERREALRRELKVIGDTNHHIRNALELIQLSAQTTHDQQVIEQISVGVERIQWVLRELIGESSYYSVSSSSGAAENVIREKNHKTG
jgi:hypothetical protein